MAGCSWPGLATGVSAPAATPRGLHFPESPRGWAKVLQYGGMSSGPSRLGALSGRCPTQAAQQIGTGLPSPSRPSPGPQAAPPRLGPESHLPERILRGPLCVLTPRPAVHAGVPPADAPTLRLHPGVCALGRPQRAAPGKGEARPRPLSAPVSGWSPTHIHQSLCCRPRGRDPSGVAGSRQGWLVGPGAAVWLEGLSLRWPLEGWSRRARQWAPLDRP